MTTELASEVEEIVFRKDIEDIKKQYRDGYRLLQTFVHLLAQSRGLGKAEETRISYLLKSYDCSCAHSFAKFYGYDRAEEIVRYFFETRHGFYQNYSANNYFFSPKFQWLHESLSNEVIQLKRPVYIPSSKSLESLGFGTSLLA